MSPAPIEMVQDLERELTPALESFRRVQSNVLGVDWLHNSEGRKAIRLFFHFAADPNSNISGIYRGPRAGSSDVEEDLARGLEAFRKINDGVPPALLEYQLRQIRRFLLMRYAYRMAREVEQMIRNIQPGQWQKEPRLWFWKDHITPRLGLSLLAGYGLALGLENRLQELGRNWVIWSVVVVLSLVLAWFLLFLNVKSHLGAPAQKVYHRTWSMVGRALVWSTASGAVYWFLWRPSCKDAVLTALIALVFALVVQFFFEDQASIAEPL